jgi:hypothetical protein
MQPSLPTKPQPEPENKWPGCLYLKLEGIPVEPENQDGLDWWHTSTQTHQINLYLTIKFDEQWQTIKNGRIKFGLKGGELRLKLENGEIPYEDRELSGSIELSIPNPRQELDVTKNGQGARSLIKAQPNSSKEQKLPSIELMPVTICHVTTKVSEENPVWIFEEEKGESVLKGFLKKAKLATMNAIALPCRVEATFEVSRRDVCLTDAEGLWPPNISRNKRAVLDRLIIQRLLEPKFKPYLSRAELHYD